MPLTFWQEDKSPFRWRRLVYLAAFLWLGVWLSQHDHNSLMSWWKALFAVVLGLLLFKLVLIGIAIAFPSFFDRKPKPDRDEEPRGL